jgi:hypothetical protein
VRSSLFDPVKWTRATPPAPRISHSPTRRKVAARSGDHGEKLGEGEAGVVGPVAAEAAGRTGVSCSSASVARAARSAHREQLSRRPVAKFSTKPVPLHKPQSEKPNTRIMRLATGRAETEHSVAPWRAAAPGTAGPVRPRHAWPRSFGFRWLRFRSITRRCRHSPPAKPELVC